MSEESAFIEIDEEDPFEAVELRVRGPDGVTFKAGEVEAESGRFGLVRVDDE